MTDTTRKMKRIPIAAAERIAKDFGYDQVIIIARRVGEDPEPNGEWMTTYGVNKAHCDAADRAGQTLRRFMEEATERNLAAKQDA